MTFPAVESPNGRLLTGLGTPDVKKTWGTHTIYASKYADSWSDPVNEIDPKLMLTGRSRSVTGSDLVHLELPAGDQIEAKTFVFGPDNFTLTDELRAAHPELPKKVDVPLTLRIDRTEQRVAFAVSGSEVSAKAGEWTDWLSVNFEFNPLLSF